MSRPHQLDVGHHAGDDFRVAHFPLGSGDPTAARHGSALALQHVSRVFGGVSAVSDLSLEVPAGQIFGIIGPNGAGKTTVFNIITGLFPASSGRVLLGNQDITRHRPSDIARAGVGRTFQSVHLFAGMTVLENVLMGQSRYVFTGLLSLVPVLADRKEAQLRTEAQATLDFLGLGQYAAAAARELPYALQREVEMARALAGRPRALLLDEPAAGFNDAESRQLIDDIRRIRDSGVTVVLIEHDMSVVMEVCERIAVLNFGHKIAEGSPSQVRADPQVVEAYLGSEHDKSAAAHSASFG